MKIQTTEAVRRFNEAIFIADLVTDMQYDTRTHEVLAERLAEKGRPMIAAEIRCAARALTTESGIDKVDSCKIQDRQ